MADNTRKEPKDWVSGDDPMTGAQESYLKTLAEQAHRDLPEEYQGRGLGAGRRDAAKGRAGAVTRILAGIRSHVYANEIGNRKCLISFAPATERARSF